MTAFGPVSSKGSSAVPYVGASSAGSTAVAERAL
jgi:hypothetical protein